MNVFCERLKISIFYMNGTSSMIQRFQTARNENSNDNSYAKDDKKSFVLIGEKRFVATADSEYSDIEILTEDVEYSEIDDYSDEEPQNDKYSDMQEIDLKNMSKPMYVSRYADKIFLNDQLLEKDLLIKKGSFENIQKEITPKMRSIVVRWLITLAEEFSFSNDTIFNSIAYLDHYLANKSIEKDSFQLLGAVCLWLAAKCEELTIPAVTDIADLCNKVYTVKDFCNVERDILKYNNYRTNYPTMKTFLRRFQVAVEANKEILEVSSFLCEASLMSHIIPCYRPSLAALSIMIITTIGLNNECPLDTLIQYNHKDNMDDVLILIPLIMNCANEIVSKRQGTTYQKYVGLHPNPSILKIDYSNQEKILSRLQ